MNGIYSIINAGVNGGVCGACVWSLTAICIYACASPLICCALATRLIRELT